MNANRSAKPENLGAQSPPSLNPSDAIIHSLGGAKPSAQPEQTPEVQEKADYKIVGARAGAFAAVGATLACVAAAAPTLISATSNLFGPAAAQSLAKVDLMATLNASTSAGLFGLVAFIIIPEIEKARRLAVMSAAKQTEEHRLQQNKIEDLTALVGIISRQTEDLRRALETSTQRSGGGGAPRGNGEMLNRPEAFGGAGPGPAQTLEPHMVQEAKIEVQKDGGYRVYPMDNDVPEFISRLRRDHPTTLWQVFLPISHDRECLDVLIRLIWSLRHYATIAYYRGRPLDLTKLEIRVMDSKPSGITTVLFPQVGRGGEVKTTVRQYQFQDVKSGDGRIAFAVKGPLHEKAVQRRDEALRRSHVVHAGALAWLLGDCVPDEQGCVSAEAITRWLTTPMRTIGELLNWQPQSAISD